MSKYKVGDILLYEDDIRGKYYGSEWTFLIQVTDISDTEYEVTTLDCIYDFRRGPHPPGTRWQISEAFLRRCSYFDYAFDISSTYIPESNLCTCDKYEVINFGCKCGGA